MEHVIVLYNLLDGGSSYSGPLPSPSESMRGGILGTNPSQQLLSTCQMSRCCVIWIFLVYNEFVEYSISGTK
jgi:hypothetical protein